MRLAAEDQEKEAKQARKEQRVAKQVAHEAEKATNKASRVAKKAVRDAAKLQKEAERLARYQRREEQKKVFITLIDEYNVRLAEWEGKVGKVRGWKPAKPKMAKV